MTGPHLIITAICLTGALTSLWLLRQASGHRSLVTSAPMAAPVDETAPLPVSASRPLAVTTTSVTDPVLVVRQACLAMEDVARRREIDLLRPFNVSVPRLDVPRGPLIALLKSVLQNALEATPRRGAVICSIKMTPNHVHFIVSDSSGCAEDGAALLAEPRWRKESLHPSALVAEALGGRLLHTDYPGEGVVIDLAFRRHDKQASLENKSFGAWHNLAGNDHGACNGDHPSARAEALSDRVSL